MLQKFLHGRPQMLTYDLFAVANLLVLTVFFLIITTATLVTHPMLCRTLSHY